MRHGDASGMASYCPLQRTLLYNNWCLGGFKQMDGQWWCTYHKFGKGLCKVLGYLGFGTRELSVANSTDAIISIVQWDLNLPLSERGKLQCDGVDT